MCNRRVLVVNRNWVPISQADWQRAFIMVFSGKAEVLDYYDEIVRTPSSEYLVPAVIRVNYSKVPSVKITYSREAVFARDDFRCQYCGRNLRGQQKTIDHIIPRSHGGRTSFLNTVTCCSKCNKKKSNKLLNQSGMKLLTQPSIPIHVSRQKLQGNVLEWAPYLR